MVTSEYLEQLKSKIQCVLGPNLVGLYQIGSSCMNDFRKGKSDLDIVGVLSSEIQRNQRNEISSTLDHKNFNCPAQGLDLILFTSSVVKGIVDEPRYEFWFSTGAGWITESSGPGRTSEMHIFLAQCKEHGLTLHGPEPGLYFAQREKKKILSAFLEMLKWHQTKILDDFHDPGGQNSVLNACRVLAYLAESNLISKTAGGEWFLKKYPDNNTVQKALSSRLENGDLQISESEITKLLDHVMAELAREARI